MQGVKLCRPQQACELVMNLRDGSKWLPIPPRESDAVAETAGAWGGQKCSAIKHPPPQTPCLGLQKQDRLPQRTLPFCQPRGLLQTAQEFGIGIRQGLQLGGEFLPSSVWLSYCLGTGIPVFPVWLSCPPSSLFWYCVFLKGKGHVGCDIWVWREMNCKQW